jgi:hypothetical protein
MTDFKTSDRDVNRAIRSWLHEDRHEDVSRVTGAVLDQVDTIPQRRATRWPARRTPTMNKSLAIGLCAAAVVVAVLVGAQIFSSPNGGVGAGPTPTATAEPTPEPTPSPSAEAALEQGPFLVFDPATQTAPFDDGPPITVTIPASGWTSLPQFSALTKGDQADPPEGAGAGLLTGDTGADGLYVYGDPCHWESTTPDTAATTVDEIVEALGAQASRDATEPVDVPVGGYAGKSITLHVPNDGSHRATAFADCDQSTFATYGVAGLEGPARYQHGPGQVDEFWILDVDGAIVILDAMYGPATPDELIVEVRSLAESATFEAP